MVVGLGTGFPGAVVVVELVGGPLLMRTDSHNFGEIFFIFIFCAFCSFRVFVFCCVV